MFSKVYPGMIQIFGTRNPRDSIASFANVFDWYNRGLYSRYEVMDFWYFHLALPYQEKVINSNCTMIL